MRVARSSTMPGVAPPEATDHVAVEAVPLRPRSGEAADPVAARPDVPRLGDELDAGHDRVLVDRVEEGALPLELAARPGEDRGEVEPEPVDVHLLDPVAQAVHDQLEHPRVADVERVARPREVQVAAAAFGQEVIGPVVDAPEGEGRADLAGLRRVVVDDVEDHLEAGRVERLDHGPELPDHPGRVLGGRVARVRGEVAEGVVAPVVHPAAPGEGGLVDVVVDREELDRGHAERSQVDDDRLRRQPGVRPAQRRRDGRVALREALHVRLVDHRPVPRNLRAPVGTPLERCADDDAARRVRRRIAAVTDEVAVRAASRWTAQERVVPADVATDGPGVRVQEQLRRVEAEAAGRVERAVDPEAVCDARPEVGQVAVEDAVGPLRQLDPGRLAVLVRRVEQAQLRPLGGLAEQRDVDAPAVPCRPEREGAPGPDPRRHRGDYGTVRARPRDAAGSRTMGRARPSGRGAAEPADQAGPRSPVSLTDATRDIRDGPSWICANVGAGSAADREPPAAPAAQSRHPVPQSRHPVPGCMLVEGG